MMQVGATRYYYLFDSLGSVIGLTDASGTLVESYRYSVYGQPLQTSTVGNPYLFTGRRFDSETGLYYYRARYYSPELRRFIEPDPIGFEGGMNLYAYVGNDPGNALDPLGLQEEGIGYGNMHALQNFSSALSSTRGPRLSPVSPSPAGVDDPRNATVPVRRQKKEFGYGNMHAMRNLSAALSSNGYVPQGPTDAKQMLTIARVFYSDFANPIVKTLLYRTPLPVIINPKLFEPNPAGASELPCEKSCP